MAITSDLDALTNHWWVLLLRGILAILFGIVAFSMPGMTLLWLALIVGTYALIDGFVAVWVGGTTHTWGLMLVGVVGIIFGAYAFLYPGRIALMLLFAIAFWAILRGISEIVGAIQLRKEITGEWVLILAGVLSVLFGVVLFTRPGVGVLAMIAVIGVYALIYGMFMIILSFRVRGLHSRSEHIPGAA